MTGIKFSACGTSWRAIAVTKDMLTVPDVPGSGLVFTSANGEMRFLALDENEMPPLDALESKTNAELSVLVQSADVLAGQRRR